MATIDGTDEPLFADDLSDYEDDDDPPPLPPPVVPRPLSTTHTHDTGLRVGTNSQTTPTRGVKRAVDKGDGVTDTTNEEPKKVRKPMLKLSVDKLFAEKGLPYLTKEFPKLKFKGKGHEASDLKYLLQQYEHWANRVYPKFTFHDFIQRVETLGSKSAEFKSRFREMRLQSAGIPGEDEEIAEGEERMEEEIEERDTQNNENTEPNNEESYQLSEAEQTESTPNPWDVIPDNPRPHNDIIEDNPYDDIDDILLDDL